MSKRKRIERETPEYADMLRRMIRAYGRRVADADDYDLAEMADVLVEFQEAVQYALAVAPVRERLMVRLGGEIGLRRAEVARVHSDDLTRDLDGWSLLVHGKGGRERYLPLPPLLAAELLDLPKGWAFPGDDHGHLSPRWVGTLVSRLLPEGWTMHSLRHRFAARTHEVERDLVIVQELLGHASIVTTRNYVPVRRDRLRLTVEAAAANGPVDRVP